MARTLAIMALEPDMDARLAAHFDTAPQRLVKSRRNPPDYRVLSFVANVRGVELAEVVIPYPIIGRLLGQRVQHPLINRARHNEPVRQVERTMVDSTRINDGAPRAIATSRSTSSASSPLSGLSAVSARGCRRPINMSPISPVFMTRPEKLFSG